MIPFRNYKEFREYCGDVKKCCPECPCYVFCRCVLNSEKSYVKTYEMFVIRTRKKKLAKLLGKSP